jgi:uncharacterized protein DUF6894
MRCYFNLVSSHHTITDAEGLEVADVDEARSFAREAAAEMSQDGVAEIAHWRGWEVEARDASGTVLFTVGFEALLPAETQETELPRRRMEPTLTTRRHDLTGMWPVGTTDCA